MDESFFLFVFIFERPHQQQQIYVINLTEGGLLLSGRLSGELLLGGLHLGELLLGGVLLGGIHLEYLGSTLHNIIAKGTIPESNFSADIHIAFRTETFHSRPNKIGEGGGGRGGSPSGPTPHAAPPLKQVYNKKDSLM